MILFPPQNSHHLKKVLTFFSFQNSNLAHSTDIDTANQGLGPNQPEALVMMLLKIIQYEQIRFSKSDFHFFEIGFKSRSFGGSGGFSLSPSSSPRRDLSNELGPSSGNKKSKYFFLGV